MKIVETKCNLLNVPRGYYLAHCISGDYALAGNLESKMNIYYNMRYKLFRHYPIPDKDKYAEVGESLLVDDVFNLVIKSKFNDKATYEALEKALNDMKFWCNSLYIDNVAIPKLGCGGNGLEWDLVKNIIEKVFGNTDIKFLVCTDEKCTYNTDG